MTGSLLGSAGVDGEYDGGELSSARTTGCGSAAQCETLDVFKS